MVVSFALASIVRNRNKLACQAWDATDASASESSNLCFLFRHRLDDVISPDAHANAGSGFSIIYDPVPIKTNAL